MPLSHCIFKLLVKLWSTFRALVYKLLVEFEQQLIFKVSRGHPGSLISEQQSSTAEESLAGGRGRSASIEFQGQFFDIVKGVASTPSSTLCSIYHCSENCLAQFPPFGFPPWTMFFSYSVTDVISNVVKYNTSVKIYLIKSKITHFKNY